MTSALHVPHDFASFALPLSSLLQQELDCIITSLVLHVPLDNTNANAHAHPINKNTSRPVHDLKP